MKSINLILGVATTIILAALISLGIAAFYPAPTSPSYPSTPTPVPCASGDAACLKANAQADAAARAAQNVFNNEETAYTQAMGVYGRNLFIIANIIGLIVFAAGFFLMFGGVAIAARGVLIGAMLAGLWSIIYGYAAGWGSVNDMFKFFFGLAVAIVVIGGSAWLMQRHAKGGHA